MSLPKRLVLRVARPGSKAKFAPPTGTDLLALGVHPRTARNARSRPRTGPSRFGTRR
jgi:hypothetical protein